MLGSLHGLELVEAAAWVRVVTLCGCRHGRHSHQQSMCTLAHKSAESAHYQHEHNCATFSETPLHNRFKAPEKDPAPQQVHLQHPCVVQQGANASARCRLKSRHLKQHLKVGNRYCSQFVLPTPVGDMPLLCTRNRQMDACIISLSHPTLSHSSFPSPAHPVGAKRRLHCLQLSSSER